MSKLKTNAIIAIIFALFLINPADRNAEVTAKPQSNTSKTNDRLLGFKQSGIASWYGPGFQGRKTANGERFNTHEMTAAHKTLPFNTYVKVTNLNNGMSTVVRINDRGPYIKGRIIDLSNKAKKEIGMDGTANVEIEVIDPNADAEHEEEVESEEESQSSAPVTLFGNTLPVSSKVFVEYVNLDGAKDEKLSKADFNEFIETARKVKIKVITASSTNSNIYQHVSELPSLNYYDVTNRVKFIKGYTLKVGSFSDRALAYDLVGELESNNLETIFIEENITDGSTSYIIYAGNYKVPFDAAKDKQLLNKMKYEPKLVKIGS